ncbi:3-oxoacyl-[ACP] synthase [Caballeronia glathei]|uniref:Beta-ketoacyl synthase-like N-terminal domain-containing protein n=1 Tax=Caballeronia glathei TaxID=60547 RepID=A0A069PUL4_9BURK|nr:beta-ketoacyl synthase chain length factor [Caballeronia glathei]KDR44483.1 hypothetical protein BG61_12330 [Caballeronia glathei]CDY74040.1 3-oxoacyl-[ACP] synthase [Caballeronia glathei]
MPELQWTVPIARWSASTGGAVTPADLGFIEPMLRRRLSSLSKTALKVAHDCAAPYPHARVVFASRHGELRRTTDILDAMSAREPVSPTAFSLSVLNAMTGVFGIARGDRSAATAVSSGEETLGYALLEGYTQYVDDPASPVLVVYADEPVGATYGEIERDVPGGALALLIDDTSPARLECVVSGAPQPKDEALFASQSEALQHALETKQSAGWQSAGADASRWQWRWHDGAA